MNPMRILLRNSIDYAGLFPPAGLDMQTSVANYAAYRAGPDVWALGRFVLPASRLPEFTEALRPLLDSRSPTEPWLLAALAGTDFGSDLDLIRRFNDQQLPARVDTVEFRADSAEAIHDRMHWMPHHLQAYVEIPVSRDPARLLPALEQAGGRAKVRTGGVTRDAFPSPAELIRFIASCVAAGVPFKATAGLHHPVRAEYQLTYAADSERGLMFGFLNLFLATGFLWAGMEERRAVQVLEEASATAFEVGESGIRWDGRSLSLDDLQRVRQEVIISFGSCSFTEPLTELQALYLLEPGMRPG
jgi:hypothetical protein